MKSEQSAGQYEDITESGNPLEEEKISCLGALSWMCVDVPIGPRGSWVERGEKFGKR